MSMQSPTAAASHRHSLPTDATPTTTTTTTTTTTPTAQPLSPRISFNALNHRGTMPHLTNGYPPLPPVPQFVKLQRVGSPRTSVPSSPQSLGSSEINAKLNANTADANNAHSPQQKSRPTPPPLPPPITWMQRSQSQSVNETNKPDANALTTSLPQSQSLSQSQSANVATHIRTSSTSINNQSQSPAETYRLLADELLSSEQTYSAQLNTLVTVYIQRLRAYHALQRPILSEEEMNIIFNNIEQLSVLSSQFCNELKQLKNNNNNNNNDNNNNNSLYSIELPHLIIRYTHEFKHYIPYVYSYDDSNRLLQLLKNTKKNDFDFFIKIQEFCEKNRKIEDYLILPIQRIPRYLLLLKSLYENALNYDQNLSLILSTAVEHMSELTTAINDSLHTKSSRLRVINLQQSLNGESINLLSDNPHRIHIMNGTLHKKYNNSLYKSKNYQRYMFHLLSDILLYTTIPDTTGKGLCKLKYILPLHDMTIMSVNDNAHTSSGQSKDSKRGYLFEIRSGSVKSFLVSADSEVEKTRWIDCINETIEKCQAESATDKRNSKEEMGIGRRGINLPMRGSFSQSATEDDDDSSNDASVTSGIDGSSVSNMYITSPMLMPTYFGSSPRRATQPPPISPQLLASTIMHRRDTLSAAPT